MSFPEPTPGLVIRYSYLWLAEHRKGQEEGVKDRPCAIVLSLQRSDEGQVVTVPPITHTPPVDPAMAVESPPAVKRRLGLDDERSWIVLTEANRFVWPGPDLRPTPRGNAASVAYGPLPYQLFEKIRLGFLDAPRKRRMGLVARSD